MTRASTRTAAAPARPKLTGDELLEQINPQKRRADTWICLRADLIESWETENETLQEMRAKELTASSQRLAAAGGGSAKVKTQARKVQKIEAEIEATQMHFLFESITPDRKSELAIEHPPRKGDTFDAMTGYNREAMARVQVRECLIEPAFSDQGWARLMSVIPPGEWDELVQTCDRANGRVTSLPKSPLAESLLRARNGTSSSSPESGE